MANNSEFTIKVNVKGGADIDAIKKALEGLGATVKRTGASTKDADKNSNDFYDTQKKGIIGTANSTKSFSKLAETIGGRSSGLVSAYAELAANAFALTAAFNALRGASQVEQVFRGLEAAGSRTGQALTVSARALREVTGAAIDTEQSLRSTAQIASAGFGEKTIKALGQAARDTSFALGRNMTDSLDRLTRGVVKLEPELLDELGIMTKLTDSNTQYASKLGKSESQLTNFEKRQGFLNAVLAEAQLKFGGLSDEAGDSTAYDKLSAALTDLKNNVLAIANTALKPLANILASNPTALLAVVILFSSTLATKLLPFLANSVATANAAAKASLDHANALKADTISAIENARAQEQANLTRLRGLTSLKDAGPKIYQQMNDKIKAGTASAKDYDAAILSLQRRLRADQGIVANNPKFAADTDKGQEKLTRIGDTQAEISRLQELKKMQDDVGKTETNRFAAVRQARLAAAAATSYAMAQDKAAAAIGAASQLSITDAIKNTTAATLAYARSLAIARQAQIEAANMNTAPALSFFDKLRAGATSVQTAVGRLWTNLNNPSLGGIDKARVGLFGLGVAAKAAGSAFLAIIPIIGQIMFAVSIVKMGIDAMKSDATKKLEKAFDDFKQVVESTDKSITALNRTQTSTASLALRTQQAILIQSNAISTLVDAYDDLIAKQGDVAKKGTGGSGVAGFFEELIPGSSTKNYASNILNIDKTSKALQAFESNLPTIFSPTAGVDKDPVLSASIVTLEKLNKLAPEATQKAILFAGGWEQFSKLPLDQKLNMVNKIANDVNSQYKDAAEKVTSLVDAFKNLNQAIGDFALAQQQTTPFDQVVKGFQAVNNGIREFQTTASKSANVSADQYKGLLSGMGSNIDAFLTPKTNDQLKAFREINDQVQQLEANRAAGLAIDDRQLTNLKARRDAQTGVLDSVNAQLQSTQKQFEVAQEMDRVLKSQQTVLQANLSANQANYAATASGVKARMEGENRIKQLQISQLQVQKTILESYIGQNRAQIDSLKSQIEMIKSGYDFNRVIDEGNIMLRQRAANLREQAAEMRLSSRGINPQQVLMSPGLADDARKQLGADKQLVDDYIKAHTEADKINTLQSDYAGIQKAEQAVKGYESSVSNLVNQINALAISENTAGQIAAEAGAKRAEIINQQTKQLEEQQKTLRTAYELDVKTNRLLQGRSDTLADQVGDIQRVAAASRAQFQSENRDARRTLEAELAKARADSAVARDAGSKQANADRIALLQEQLRLENQGLQVNLLQLDAQTRSQIIEKVAFDTQTQGLQMQQEALSYLEKQLQARKDLVDAANEEGTLTREIVRRQNGRAQTDSSKQNDELIAARAAYDYAVDEAELRRTTIKLEYALLEAQRQTQLNNLQVQKAALVASGQANSDMVRQLDATIEGLNNAAGYIQSAQQDATKLVDRQVEIARLKMRQTALPEGTNTTFGQRVRDRRELQRNRDSVNRGDWDRTDPVKAIATAIAPTNKITADTLESIRNLITSNVDLKAALDSVTRQLADKQTGNESATNSTLSRMPLRAEAVGAAVAERLGNVITSATRKAGEAGNAGNRSHHVSSSAIDVRPKKGQNPQDIVDLLKSLGLQKVRFIDETSPAMMKKTGATGPHWHFDWDPVSAATKALDTVTTAAVTKIEDTSPVIGAAAPAPVSGALVSTQPANDNTPDTGDIVVTGTRPPKAPGVGQAGPSPFRSDVLDDFKDLMNQSGSISEVFSKMADDLGPSGQIVPTILNGINSIGDAYVSMRNVFNDKSANPGDKIAAVAQVAQAALSTIQSAMAASASAKEDAIQREIDAETKRDGKSTESVAKIQALEKRKDEIAKKQFNTNKKLQMAQAVIATAAGVAQALSLGPIVGPIMAGVIAAMGAAQIAIISGTQYQSSASTASASTEVPTLTIGKRGDTVDLAHQNNNVGGELGYLRGRQGTGTNSSNYSVIGSAYGGDLPRGYGNTAYVVGEKGPETIMAQTPITVRPANDNSGGNPVSATINIHAIDARGVEDVLHDQKGNLISMFREAANANGQPFLEDVNIATYSRPNRTANGRL